MSPAAGYWLQQAINFIQLFAFYAPLAVAFALLQGVTRRVFLSFGDVSMFASFAAIYTCFDSQLHGYSEGLTAALSLLAALLCSGALGAVLSRVVLGERLTRHAMAFMIASVGLSIVIQEVMRLQSSSRAIWIPPLFQGQEILLSSGSFPVRVPLMLVVSCVVSVVALLLIGLVMKYLRFGREWRACVQSVRLASLCGVDSARVMTTTFALAAMLSAISGWTSAIYYGGTSFSIGLMMGFKAMFASVVGGFGSVKGAVAGSLLLASVEIIWSSQFSMTYRDVAVFAIITFILLLKPDGVAGLGDRRESEVP